MSDQNLSILIGIIGTLLGTLLGWILNSINHIGKLKFYISQWNEEIMKIDEIGNSVECNPDQSEWYNYKIILDIYNKSDIPKIMRDINIRFVENQNVLYKEVPDDDKTKRFSAAQAWYDKVEPLTIQPKTIQQVVLRSSVDTRKNKSLFAYNSIWLVYNDNRNISRRILIYKR